VPNFFKTDFVAKTCSDTEKILIKMASVVLSLVEQVALSSRKWVPRDKDSSGLFLRSQITVIKNILCSKKNVCGEEENAVWVWEQTIETRK